MNTVTSKRRLLLALPLLALSACSSSVKLGPEAVAGLTPDATVDMNQVQAAFIGSGGGGQGTLYYQGQSYPFIVGGLGIGGIGVSTVAASGEVYKLNNISQFPGTYGRPATVSRWATEVAAISGCRTSPESSCT